MQLEKKILIIDDNQYFSSALESLLDEDGFKIQTCPNAVTAYALAKERQFDIYIVDYRLPEITGDTLTAAIRKIQPSAIIIGCSVELKEQQFLSAGADTFMLKDMLPVQFSVFIRRHQMNSGDSSTNLHFAHSRSDSTDR